jgi:hypothetical protein
MTTISILLTRFALQKPAVNLSALSAALALRVCVCVSSPHRAAASCRLDAGRRPTCWRPANRSGAAPLHGPPRTSSARPAASRDLAQISPRPGNARSPARSRRANKARRRRMSGAGITKFDLASNLCAPGAMLQRRRLLVGPAISRARATRSSCLLFTKVNRPALEDDRLFAFVKLGQGPPCAHLRCCVFGRILAVAVVVCGRKAKVCPGFGMEINSAKARISGRRPPPMGDHLRQRPDGRPPTGSHH